MFTTRRSALRSHWPEYLIEAWALGMFMLSAGVFTTMFEYPGSVLHAAIANADVRRALTGAAMGLTAIALIYSPWGQRSGAHMNPAVTLAFWRLGKVASGDALWYSLAQFVGGTLGVLLTAALLHQAFTSAPVSYIATVPGPHGAGVALLTEFAISALMMWTVLRVSNSRRHARFTGVCAGMLVTVFITFEAPLSGMSMNPARSFASAWLAGVWTHFWIYLLAPVLGMQVAATWYRHRYGRRAASCAKLLHPITQRCIHCGHVPVPQNVPMPGLSGGMT